MQNKLFKILGMLFVSLLLGSCYYDKEEILYAIAKCDTSNVSFAKDILPILSNRCATVGCHVQGGSGTGLYENYNQVKASVDAGKFKDRVLVRKDMPPSSPLTDCQVQHMEKWIANGSPNN